MKNDNETRAFNIELSLDHDAEAVWQALTDPEIVTRWFPPKASVTPGVGGQITWEWEDVGKFESEIETWTPGRRLRLLEHKTDASGAPVIHTMDFRISPEAHGTTLRLIHSGFGKDAEWDNEFEGISAGWPFELRVLRHYLDHHRDKTRHLALWVQKSPFSEAKSHATVFGAIGFLAEGTISGKAEGDPYRMVTTLGDDLSGTVLLNNPPKSFAGVVPSLDHSIIRYEMDGDSVIIALEIWGNHETTAQAFQRKWQPKIKQLFT